ncbi:SDR family oxidoreductase [Patescibacteria group bacterium]|nr:SDR family oxidoreductase [Patescibacteria group bacterium]MBU1472988.1 SDR family oxidoreductase [Patescibacteria group bacterium]MBU2567614.1 SDR family oxidoreductase [Elusimicrobiota bacterium]
METDFSKVLVTGSSGMVGSYVDFGIKTDHRSLDVTDLSEVLRVSEFYKPKVIFHLAAETDVDRCERDPEHAYLVNSIGTYNMAVAARNLGAKLVYISTAGVFDGTKKEPYTEEDEPNPQNYYGRSKYLGELIVKSVLKDYIIARAGWMFGGGPEKDQKFVAKIINQLDKPEIRAVNDKIGSPTYAKDLISGIKKLLVAGRTGIFHLSSKGVCSRYDVALSIVKSLRPSVKVLPVDSSYFKLDAARVCSEAMISKEDLSRPWQEALEEYLDTEWKPFLK